MKRECNGKTYCCSTWNRNFGDILTSQVLLDIIKKHKHITCVLFYGGDWKEDIDFLLHLLKIVRTIGLKTALYSGYDEINENLASMLDYYKIWRYIEEKGGLENKNTNQILFSITENDKYTNITTKLQQ